MLEIDININSLLVIKRSFGMRTLSDFLWRVKCQYNENGYKTRPELARIQRG